jgi:hypothetical protein
MKAVEGRSASIEDAAPRAPLDGTPALVLPGGSTMEACFCRIHAVVPGAVDARPGGELGTQVGFAPLDEGPRERCQPSVVVAGAAGELRCARDSVSGLLRRLRRR